MNSLDKELALKASAGNEQLANQLLKMFIEQSADYQKKIETPLKRMDKDQLQIGIHKLHGAMKYIGAPRLLSLVEQLDGNLSKFSDNEIIIICEQIFSEITHIISLENYHTGT